MDKILNYIIKCNLKELSELTLLDITREFSISKVYLIRIFKAKLGITPAKFILREKMTRIATLMKERPDLNLSALAEIAGLSSVDYFIRVFKSHFGLPPCRYRDACLQKESKDKQGD